VRSGGRRRNAPRAPSQTFFFLLDADRPALARADPQHPAAKPEPSQHAPVTTVPGATFARCQGPRSGELLDARFLVAPTYKYPRRSNEDTRLTPSYIPDTLAPSLSLWFVDARHGGEALDAKRAAAFDHPGASRRWESEEEHRRSRSRTSPSSPASSTRVAIAVVVFTATPVIFPRLHEHDAPEPLDPDLTIAYRFGKDK
jgi:hypothetical protein